MWVWILIVAIFLYLMAKSLGDGLSSTASRPLAFLAALTDGVAMLSMAAGLFGLLMALVLGVFANYGPRLVGASLYSMLVWCGVLMLTSLVFLILGSFLRRAASRYALAPLQTRGGH
jgi:hypothetical protein